MNILYTIFIFISHSQLITYASDNMSICSEESLFSDLDSFIEEQIDIIKDHKEKQLRSIGLYNCTDTLWKNGHLKVKEDLKRMKDSFKGDGDMGSERNIILNEMVKNFEEYLQKGHQFVFICDENLKIQAVLNYKLNNKDSSDDCLEAIIKEHPRVENDPFIYISSTVAVKSDNKLFPFLLDLVSFHDYKLGFDNFYLTPMADYLYDYYARYGFKEIKHYTDESEDEDDFESCMYLLRKE